MTKSKARRTKRPGFIEAYGGLLVDGKQLDSCCRELAKFADTVGKLVEEIKDNHALTANFVRIAEMLVKIKGSARQMRLARIGDLAEVAEDLAVRGGSATERHVVRKVSLALWDAVTTLSHMLDHVGKDTSTEADILMKRLQRALKALGGSRPKLDQAGVDGLFGSG